MDIRRRINRKGSGQKPSSSEPDMLQHFLISRPFGNGKKVRSPKLPTTEDILRPRPFKHQTPQPITAEDIPRIQAELEAGAEFSYNSVSIPTFAPSAPSEDRVLSPFSSIQADGLGQENIQREEVLDSEKEQSEIGSNTSF